MQITSPVSSLITNKISYFYVVFIGLLISTLHFDVFYYSHDTAKWFVFDVAITLYVAYSLKKQKQLHYSYLGIVITALIYLMILSLWWAPHTVAGIEFTVRFLNCALFAYCLTKNNSSEKLTDIVIHTIFLSALGFSLLFIIERYALGLSYNVGTFSPIGFINNTSAAFNIWIPGLVMHMVRCYKLGNRPIQMALGIFSLLVVVSILMETGTRGAILGLSISELIIFAIVLKKNAKQAFLFLTITSLLLIGIGIYNVSDSLQNGRLDAKISSMKKGLGSAGESRLKMYQNTWSMTLDNPFGVGINNFEYVHPKYAQVGTDDASPYVNEKQILRTPHNLTLKIYSELGFIGGTLFTIMLLYCFIIAIYNATKGDYIDKWLFVGISATLFHTMLSAVLLTPTSLFFFVISIAVINARYADRIKPQRCFSSRLPIILKTAYSLIIIFSLSLLISEFYAFKGRINFSGEYLTKALHFNHQNDRALLNLSQFQLYRGKDLNASLSALEQFLSLYPFHIAALMMKAERQYQLKDLPASNKTLEQLLHIYPGYKKAIRLNQLVNIKIKQHQIRHNNMKDTKNQSK